MAQANKGKLFEKHFKESVKSAKGGTVWCYRIKDLYTLQSNFGDSSSYTPTNICDYLLFDQGNLFALELKSTHFKSVGFELDPLKEDKMIKRHQIKDLSQMSLYEGIIPGFIFNFRDETLGTEQTYFLHIKNFNDFLASTEKKSINIADIVLFGGIPVEARKKRKYYEYNIEKMLTDIRNKQ